MAYAWGDVEERLELWEPLAGAEKDDYQAIEDSWLAAQVAAAFRVEAQYDENGFGDPCVFFVLLYDVTVQKAREAAAAVDSSAALRRFIRIHSSGERTWPRRVSASPSCLGKTSLRPQR